MGSPGCARSPTSPAAAPPRTCGCSRADTPGEVGRRRPGRALHHRRSTAAAGRSRTCRRRVQGASRRAIAQEIRRFERVHDRPMHAGVMIDVSGSMVEELPRPSAPPSASSRGADAARPRRGLHLRRPPAPGARFTGHLDVLAGALAGLEARGRDPPLRQPRLLPPLLHRHARPARPGAAHRRLRHRQPLRFDEVLDYARRTGVAIYSIGLGVPSKPGEAGCASTSSRARPAGAPSTSTRASELARVYARSARSSARSG